jgi:hypothetical protein
MAAFIAGDIGRRVRSLIEHHDSGDEAAAAWRHGVYRDALAALLAGSLEHLDLDTLGAVMDAYEVDATWLLTGERELPTAALSVEARLEIAEVLSQLSARVLSQYATRNSNGARKVARATQAVAYHWALAARHHAAVAEFQSRRAQFLEDVEEYETRRAERLRDATERHRAVQESAAARAAREELREAVRCYVAELKHEHAPLHRVLVLVKKVVRDAASTEAPALPWREADALMEEVVQVALDAYHTAA